MDIELTSLQARVIGCLIEKAITTPEQYPLSLNALTNACNQKSNRDPVMELDEATVRQTVDELSKKKMVSEKTGFGSRVPKYHHRFCNTEFGSLQLSEQELGIICVLLLRGAQTPGELRSRADRLCKFSDVQETEAVLNHLMTREDGPFVARLAREPGKRESRYVHLFGDKPGDSDDLPSAQPSQSVLSQPKTDLDLEARVEELRRELEMLKQRVEQLESSGSPPA